VKAKSKIQPLSDQARDPAKLPADAK